MVAESGRGWNLAPSLIALVDECDRRAPNRSTASDGSIGDPAHSARVSDHNPDKGWVCAVDITDDKARGCDADLLAHQIVARRDQRVKYVIWNNTVAKSYTSRGVPAWQPQPYSGDNPHISHTHISIHNTPAARGDTRSWWGEDDDDMPITDADIDKIALKAAAAVKTVMQPQLDQLEADLKAKDVEMRDSLAKLERDLHRQVIEAISDTHPGPS